MRRFCWHRGEKNKHCQRNGHWAPIRFAAHSLSPPLTLSCFRECTFLSGLWRGGHAFWILENDPNFDGVQQERGDFPCFYGKLYTASRIRIEVTNTLSASSVGTDLKHYWARVLVVLPNSHPTVTVRYMPISQDPKHVPGTIVHCEIKRISFTQRSESFMQKKNKKSTVCGHPTIVMLPIDDQATINEPCWSSRVWLRMEQNNARCRFLRNPLFSFLFLLYILPIVYFSCHVKSIWNVSFLN